MRATEQQPDHRLGSRHGTRRGHQNGARAIADALPVLIAEVDAQERYQFNNRAYEEWFGDRRGPLEGRSMREVLGPETYGRLESRLEKALQGQEQRFEIALPGKDRSDRMLQVTYVPHLTPAGAAGGLYILMEDVTEQRELAEERIRRLNTDFEERVRQRTAQLEAMNRELEAFCYSVSHDLRAPLRAVRGFGDVLLEQYVSQLDTRGQDLLRRTCEASAQMDRLIDDLLKLSRVSRSELRAEPVGLSELAGAIAEELHQAEPGRAVEFRIEPGLKARGDERLLRVVLDNLLRNAWKFTSKRPLAQIEFGRLPGEEQAFFVRDNGAGFDMNYAGKLFGLFQRLHSSSDFPGSGVGLAIVQRIIIRHGGRAWAKGETDRGATFYFTLPSACAA